MKLLNKIKKAIKQAFKTKEEKRVEFLNDQYAKGKVLKINGEKNE